MRVALVSPYSWTYPGGVTRHIEALAGGLLRAGHDVRVLAPFDRDDRRSAVLHRGARPQPRPVPEWLVPLGRRRSAGRPTAPSPTSPARRRRSPRCGASCARGGSTSCTCTSPSRRSIGWDALTSADAPLVGTFHCYSENVPPHLVAALLGARRKLNHLDRADRGLRGRRVDRPALLRRRRTGSSPTASTLPAGGAPAAAAPRARRAAARSSFVGQAVERKGLPVLAARVRGAARARARPAHDRRRLRAGGRAAAGRPPRRRRCSAACRDAEKRGALERADVLAAPSLGGESFGMVLTEAFAAGTPVVASDIAGYRDVVADGVDGLLVPRGDADRARRGAARPRARPRRAAALGDAAARSAERYAWPRVAAQVAEAYEDARARARSRRARWTAPRCAIGVRSADLGPRRPARRLPSLEPAPARAAAASARSLRRAGLGLGCRAAPRAARTSRCSGSGSTGSATRS